MWVAVIVCATVAMLAAALALVVELLRRTPQGKLDTLVAVVLRLTKTAGVDLSLPAPRIRESFARTAASFHGKLPPMQDIRDTTVAVGDHAVPVRIYTPQGPGPRPILLYFHGGGFVEGSIQTHENICRHLARVSGRIVISVDYRLAPEHPFPSAIEDAYVVLEWAARTAATMGGITSDIVVAGDSAGGTISAVLCLMSRERRGPPVAGQVLLYPATDLGSFETESYRLFGRGYMLDARTMAWFTDQYLPDPRDRARPWASPLLAGSLEGLPRALVITAQFDVLRDEGRAYADRLRAEGVPVTYACTPGVPHGYLSATRFLKRRTRESFALVARFLAEATPSTP